MIPKKPVVKEVVPKTDDLENHYKAVEDSEFNKDKGGKNAVSQKDPKKEAQKTETKDKQPSAETKKVEKEVVKTTVVEKPEVTGDPDPRLKDVSSNTLHKISGTFVEGMWNKQSIDFESYFN